jgi:hypothetical protein
MRAERSRSPAVLTVRKFVTKIAVLNRESTEIPVNQGISFNVNLPPMTLETRTPTLIPLSLEPFSDAEPY